MEETSERLVRYLVDELSECRDGNIDRRLDDLASLETQIDTQRFEGELDIVAALANETRYTIVRALVTAREELCVCELQPLVDVSESGLSHALSKLVDAGLLEGRKDGRWKNTGRPTARSRS